jgi:hypothetical protein
LGHTDKVTINVLKITVKSGFRFAHIRSKPHPPTRADARAPTTTGLATRREFFSGFFSHKDIIRINREEKTLTSPLTPSFFSIFDALNKFVSIITTK